MRFLSCDWFDKEQVFESEDNLWQNVKLEDWSQFCYKSDTEYIFFAFLAKIDSN